MMIDLTKDIKSYNKEEIMSILIKAKEIDAYNFSKLIYKENKESNYFYKYFVDFYNMIYDKSSFTRMRGFS